MTRVEASAAAVPDRVGATVDKIIEVLLEAGYEGWPAADRGRLGEMLPSVFNQLDAASATQSAAAVCCAPRGADPHGGDGNARRWAFLQRMKAALKGLVPPMHGRAADCRFPRGADALGLAGSCVAVPPESGVFDPNVPSFEVDSFLYDDEELDELDQAGIVPRTYCKKCGSTDDLAPTQLISHSFSPRQLSYVCAEVLPAAFAEWIRPPRDALSNGADSRPVVVDVGSRLGIVLAAVAQEANDRLLPATGCHVYGVDISEPFVKVQRRLMESMKLAGPGSSSKSTVSIVHDDIRSARSLELLSTAHLVVLNNVFEWFLPVGEQLAAFEQLRDAILRRYEAAPPHATSSAPFQPSVYVMTLPDLETTLLPLMKDRIRRSKQQVRKRLGEKRPRQSGKHKPTCDHGGAELDEGEHGIERDALRDCQAWIGAWLEPVELPAMAMARPPPTNAAGSHGTCAALDSSVSSDGEDDDDEDRIKLYRVSVSHPR